MSHLHLSIQRRVDDFWQDTFRLICTLQEAEEAPASMLRLSGLVVTFAVASSLLYVIWSCAPSSKSTGKLAFPRNLDDLRQLADELEGYKDAHPLYTAVIFGYAYLYKQTFAIPGSFFLNLLAGALFGVWYGSILVCILNSIGASGCFLLSALFMKPIIDRCFKNRLALLRRKIALEREQLFMFLLGARVLPFCPHWLLNICSPFGISTVVAQSAMGTALVNPKVYPATFSAYISELLSKHKKPQSARQTSGVSIFFSMSTIEVSACYTIFTFVTSPSNVLVDGIRETLIINHNQVFPWPHLLLHLIARDYARCGISDSLIPYNVLCVRAGCVLASVRSIHDVFDLKTVLELLAVAGVFVGIGLLSRRRRRDEAEVPHGAME
ncbi:SNARE-like domain protein [Ancylostoma caninum]|uniref:SNARE-like domain protein n=1 Tax=Ancylostoma caninum TaxID=29170 RepID=A0A368FZ07_ANCCA|nr:SNARE-like domain protein [Ancylostoma caninum]